MSRQRILGKIRSGEPSPPREAFSVRGAFPGKGMDYEDSMNRLKKSLEETDTELIVLENRGDLGPAIRGCLDKYSARRVLIFPDEIPGGKEMTEWFSGRRNERGSCDINFGIDSLEGGIDDEGRELAGFDVCVTGCWYLVADGGICVIDSSAGSGRLSSLLPPHHIVVTEKSRLVSHLGKVMEMISGGEFRSRSSIVLISGPSRTADIEKQLVLGVHGPLTLTVILIS